jgi:hypothetical protein
MESVNTTLMKAATAVRLDGRIIATSTTHSTSHPTAPVHVWAIAGVIATVLCALAALQGLATWIRRRSLQKTQDELLRNYRLTADADEARKDFTEYSNRLSALREQIEIQVPIQARRDYLRERLAQLRHNLYDDFREYQQIEQELGETIPLTDIDSQIRTIIQNSIVPQRVMQDRRSLGTLILVLTLIAINLSPLSLNGIIYSYFSVLGYSNQSSLVQIAATVLEGAAVLSAVLVLAASLFSRRSRIGRIVYGPNTKKTTVAAISIGLCLVVVFIVAGLFARDAATHDYLISVGNPVIPLVVAGFAFNLLVFLLSGAAVIVWVRWRYGRNRRVANVAG